MPLPSTGSLRDEADDAAMPRNQLTAPGTPPKNSSLPKKPRKKQWIDWKHGERPEDEEEEYIPKGYKKTPSRSCVPALKKPPTFTYVNTFPPSKVNPPVPKHFSKKCPKYSVDFDSLPRILTPVPSSDEDEYSNARPSSSMTPKASKY